jgi:hypothetical protein
VRIEAAVASPHQLDGDDTAAIGKQRELPVGIGPPLVRVSATRCGAIVTTLGGTATVNFVAEYVGTNGAVIDANAPEANGNVMTTKS